MKKTHDLLAANGEYEGPDGPKTRWVKVGALFEKDGGKLSVKIDAMPVGPEWSGWLAVVEPREHEEGGRKRGKGKDFNDDVPF